VIADDRLEDALAKIDVDPNLTPSMRWHLHSLLSPGVITMDEINATLNEPS